MMHIERADWGVFHNYPVEKITIIDTESQFQVILTNIGASILQVKTPDRNGNYNDIHYGRTTPAEFENIDGAYLGVTVGRTLSAIFFAQFTLDGKNYHLSENKMKTHHMHGGGEGFDKKIWKIQTVEVTQEFAKIEFSHISIDGEEGYPGTVHITTTYLIKPNSITISFKATTDTPTIINMTNHGYWNLDGIHTTIDDLELTIAASRFVEYDTGKMIRRTVGNLVHIPNVKKTVPKSIINAEGTAMDFRQGSRLGIVFTTQGNVDHNFLLDEFHNCEEIKPLSKSPNNFTPTLHLAGILKSPKTGRILTMRTTAPGLIVYTGNDMAKVTAMGKKCMKHGAICLEPGAPTDAINQDEFASWVHLNPNTQFQRIINIEFGIME